MFQKFRSWAKENEVPIIVIFSLCSGFFALGGAIFGGVDFVKTAIADSETKTMRIIDERKEARDAQLQRIENTIDKVDNRTYEMARGMGFNVAK
jgi:hypothetical protein